MRDIRMFGKIESLNLKNQIILIIMTLVMVCAPLTVRADRYQAQIDALNAEISTDQSRISQLSSRQDTLENRLAQLRSEESKLKREIKKTEVEIAKLKAELRAVKKELKKQKEIIHENAKTLYKSGDPSAVEILFSSSNFSEFISKQEYLDSVRTAVEEAAEKTVILKQQTEEKQKKQASVLVQQKSQRTTLLSKQQEQQKLIVKTRGQESRYRSLVASKRSELGRLEAQQRAAYEAAAAAARRSGQFVTGSSGGSTPGNSGNRANGGTYPWAGYAYPCWSAGCVDPWGLYYKECVSYTAWKVSSTGRYMPHFGGRGNANQWPSTAASYGIASGSTPRSGAVAIDMSIQPYGHAMYVEQVLGGGRIIISEYNFAGPGVYSERNISSSGLVYIYF